MNNKKGLTLTLIFEAGSLNYGEGIGNVSSLKKVVKADEKAYTYISRQALRYNIVKTMGVDNTPTSDDSGVVQFSPESTIDKYPEIDLFGYMKTEKKSSGNKRSAAVRLSNAESLTRFNSEMDFLNNMGLAERSGAANALANSEIHNTMYSYTVSVDLDRVGEDGEISISQKEKASRVNDLLTAIQYLNRDIRGRNESLNPIFVVGGIYDICNPFFLNNMKMEKGKLNCELIEDIKNSSIYTKEKTVIGSIPARFKNSEEVKKISTAGVNEVFEKLKEEVSKYYEGDKA